MAKYKSSKRTPYARSRPTVAGPEDPKEEEKKEEDEDDEIKVPEFVRYYFKNLVDIVNSAIGKPHKSKIKGDLGLFVKLVPSIAAYIFYADLYGNFTFFGDVGDRKEAAKRIKEMILTLVAETNLHPLHSILGYSGAAEAMAFIDRVAHLGSYYAVLSDEDLMKFLETSESIKNIWTYIPSYISDELRKSNIELKEGLARKTALAILAARKAKRLVADALSEGINKILAKKLVD
jgi:hypothetical protein